jgi:hypothetical protein
MICKKCGVENPNSRTYCRSCAASLWPAPQKTGEESSSPLVQKPQTTGITPGIIAAALPAPIVPSVDFHRLHGVRGWLLWFCIVLTIVDPLIFLTEAVRSKSGLTIILDLALTALAIYTGVRLWQIAANALAWLTAWFATQLGLAAFILVGAIISKRGLYGPNFEINPGLEIGARILSGTIIWWAYFKKSKRVRVTYGSNI